MSGDEQLHGLLPLYLNDRLGETEVKRFREHLEACDDCQAEKAFLEDVRSLLQRGSHVLEDHPGPDRLIAAQRGELPAAEVAELERHLQLCATCSAEARWIKSDGVVVPAVSADRSVRRVGWHGAWVAGLAAATVLALILPALWRTREQPRFPDSQFVGRPELAEEVPVVTLASGASGWSAHFPVDAAATDFPCTVEVVNDAGDSVGQKTIAEPTSLVGGLYLMFSCPRSACPPGQYTLRIEADGGRLLEAIPFEVRRTP